MPKRAPSRRAAARVFQIIGVFAGEAGLLEACAGYSDTLLAALRLRERLKWLAAATVLVLIHASCAKLPSNGVDPEIAQQIAAIKAIDNHAHPPRPDPADKDFDALPVEMLEPQTTPVRLRPPGN